MFLFPPYLIPPEIRNSQVPEALSVSKEGHLLTSSRISKEFPGGLVLRIQCHHCSGPALILGWELRSCKLGLYIVQLYMCVCVSVCISQDILRTLRREEFTQIYRYCRQNLLQAIGVAWLTLTLLLKVQSERLLKAQCEIPYEFQHSQFFQSLCDQITRFILQTN